MIEMIKTVGDFDKKPAPTHALAPTPSLTLHEMRWFKEWLACDYITAEQHLLGAKYEAHCDYERFVQAEERSAQGIATEAEEELVQTFLGVCVEVVRLERELSLLRPVFESIVGGTEDDAVAVDMSLPQAQRLWQRYQDELARYRAEHEVR